MIIKLATEGGVHSCTTDKYPLFSLNVRSNDADSDITLIEEALLALTCVCLRIDTSDPQITFRDREAIFYFLNGIDCVIGDTQFERGEEDYPFTIGVSDAIYALKSRFYLAGSAGLEVKDQKVFEAYCDYWSKSSTLCQIIFNYEFMILSDHAAGSLICEDIIIDQIDYLRENFYLKSIYNNET